MVAADSSTSLCDVEACEDEPHASDDDRSGEEDGEAEEAEAKVAAVCVTGEEPVLRMLLLAGLAGAAVDCDWFWKCLARSATLTALTIEPRLTGDFADDIVEIVSL